MCCCAKPNVNGNPGYNGNTSNESASSHPVNPPALQDGDALLFDEPGRCGGLDSHSYHFRVVKHAGCILYLLASHGGGEERIRLYPHKGLPDMFGALDSNARYWILATIHAAYSNARQTGREETAATWRKAAAEGRIKTRKQRGQNSVKVWIE